MHFEFQLLTLYQKILVFLIKNIHNFIIKCIVSFNSDYLITTTFAE